MKTTKPHSSVLGAARSAAFLAILGATLLQSACVPRVQQPEVWLAGARVVSLGLQGGVVDVELGIHNPNSFGFRAGGLTYDLDFENGAGDWIDFTDGRIEETMEVDAGDTASVVVPVEFSYRSLNGAVREMLTRGSFEYRVAGTVLVRAPMVREVRYQHRGTVTPGGVR